MANAFLPTTRKEMAARGWTQADVILLSADAYVDHPAFGVAVIGRVLEAQGLRVAVIPQPDWHGDLRDFSRLGRPRMWFGVAPGCMDSMVNKYTAARRLRSSDAYSPDGRHDLRPEYPTVVYTAAVRRLFPDVPVVLGGIEASLRRLTHYDYWQDCLRPSILLDADADAIIYGMGELPTQELVARATELLDGYHEALAYDDEGNAMLTREAFRDALCGWEHGGVSNLGGLRIDTRQPLRQTVTLHDSEAAIPAFPDANDIRLHSHEDALADPRCHAENFHQIELQSNSYRAARLIQQAKGRYVVVNPPYPQMTTEQLDAVYDLPFTRLPHPRYEGHRIAAYEMIRHSITLHRGCFGGCAFCTISAHQGKQIASRSQASIMREVDAVTRMPDFHGTITDLGGPSANMYGMHGRRSEACQRCSRPSCIHPQICPNLHGDHRALTAIYRAALAHPAVKHCFVGSGVRYDLLLHDWGDDQLNRAAADYTRQLILHHVSGRLKVAPEHTSPRVLGLMRKPTFDLFRQFKKVFDQTCQQANLRQQIIPYFISSHPGCEPVDMAQLAIETRRLDFQLEQVQDFTPTPMTTATTMWATGYDPDTLQPVHVARSPRDKQDQRSFFFWYKPEERRRVEQLLMGIGRQDLLRQLFADPHAAPRGSEPKRNDKHQPRRQRGDNSHPRNHNHR